MDKKKIKLNEIKIDPKIIVRGVDSVTVSHYTEALRAGSVFPPMVIDKKNRLVCGHHRLPAHRVAFGDDHQVTVYVTDKTKDIDLIIIAAGENTKHGRPMTPIEKREIQILLEKNGISESKISEILGVRIIKLEQWADMRVAVIGQDGKTEDRPLKRGFEHMSGRSITEKAYESHRRADYGVKLRDLATHIRNILRRGEWAATDDNTIEVLSGLYDDLGKYLIKNKKVG